MQIYNLFFSTDYTTFNIYLIPFYKSWTNHTKENIATVIIKTNIATINNIISYIYP